MIRCFLCLACSAMLVCGCAGIKEGLRGFAGVSTEVLEESRQGALTKNIPVDFEEAFSLTEKFLSEAGCYLYSRNKVKGMLAVYVSETDTTPAAVFVTGSSSQASMLEAASPSTSAKEYIAAKVFGAWDKELKARKVQVQLDVVQQGGAEAK